MSSLDDATPQRFLASTSEGILDFTVDATDGRIVDRNLLKLSPAPGVFVASTDARLVYGLRESSADAEGNTGRLLVWRRADAGGAFDLLGEWSTQGVTPCYVSLDVRGAWAAVANFRGAGGRDSAGSVALFALDADGKPRGAAARTTFPGAGPKLPRQAATHPHCAVFTTSPDMLRVADLGTDSVWSLPVARGAESPLGAPVRFAARPGSGPRHLAVVQNGHALFLVDEMANALTWLKPGDDGVVLEEIARASLLPAEGDPAAAADVHVSPDARFVYASLRGRDELVGFNLDLDAQTIEPLERVKSGGSGPRTFAISYDGSLLAVMHTEGKMLNFFRRDVESGLLTPLDLRVPDVRHVVAASAVP